jgi:hypothetical protein
MALYVEQATDSRNDEAASPDGSRAIRNNNLSNNNLTRARQQGAGAHAA